MARTRVEVCYVESEISTCKSERVKQAGEHKWRQRTGTLIYLLYLPARPRRIGETPVASRGKGSG